MAVHRFDPTRFHNTLGSHEPVLRIADGDTVITATIDAWGLDAADVKRADAPNPMTGPFFVEGAEPGDSLHLRIERMTPTRATGWTFSVLAPNVVDPGAVAGLPARQRVFWSIDAAGGTARLAVQF